tara:strand:+ start:93295 stop:93471 length:177 start_codon:yes stop_codon:yes gene_type:complete
MSYSSLAVWARQHHAALREAASLQAFGVFLCLRLWLTVSGIVEISVFAASFLPVRRLQ